MNENFKGICATAITVPAAVTAWMPVLEGALRIGVSAIGMMAGGYALLYWRQKWINSKTKKRD